MHNDIPEAQRQQVSVSKRKSSPWLSPLVGLSVAGVGIVLLGMGWLLLGRGASSPPSTNRSSESTGTISPSDIFGHRPFQEAKPEELYPLQNNPGIRLREAAAIAFDQMALDASYDGVSLIALSGFRTKDEQDALFFEVKKERNQIASKRAEVSAPPGYSEHHTGFAVDIGDANEPGTHVEVEFGETEAFSWLSRNAARYSFELSFPDGNDQGVSYEPWHWRFVGDQTSLEVFHKGN